jgi:hypothetical protein
MSYTFTENKAGLESLNTILTQMKTMYVKVGFPGEKKPGKPTTEGSGHKPASDMATIATIAAVHEFGTTRAGRGNSVTIPARPFMQPALYQNKKKLGQLSKRFSTEVMTGKRTVKNSLELMGEFMVGNIQKAIDDVEEPPLSAATILAKGSSKPLIDTGQMKNSVTYIVMERAGKKEVPVDKKTETV